MAHQKHLLNQSEGSVEVGQKLCRSSDPTSLRWEVRGNWFTVLLFPTLVVRRKCGKRLELFFNKGDRRQGKTLMVGQGVELLLRLVWSGLGELLIMIVRGRW